MRFGSEGRRLVAMRWLETIEQCDVGLPMRRRRLTMMGIVGLLGGIAAWQFPLTLDWAGTWIVVMGLALLAGISSLWSP